MHGACTLHCTVPYPYTGYHLARAAPLETSVNLEYEYEYAEYRIFERCSGGKIAKRLAEERYGLTGGFEPTKALQRDKCEEKG